MTFFAIDRDHNRLKKRVSQELSALRKDVQALSQGMGPTIAGRIDCKICSLKNWLDQEDLEDRSQAIMEAETLELIMEINLQRKTGQIPTQDLKSMLDRTRAISRSIRLISSYRNLG